MAEESGRAETVRAEFVSNLSRNTTVPIITSAVIAVVVALVLFGTVSGVGLLVWVAGALLLNLARFVHLFRLRRRPGNPASVRVTANWTTWYVGLSGCLWGAAGYIFFPSAQFIFQVFLAFVLGGLVAGSLAGYGAWLPAFYSYLLPSMAPITVRFFLEMTQIAFAMGSLLFLYSVAIAVLAHTVNRSLLRSANLQVDKNALVDDLSQAKLEAENANRAKDEFLSRISHELRTPLNAILGYGQLLKRESDGATKGAGRRSVDQITQAGEHLLALINEILRLAEVNARTVSLQTANVEMRGILDACVGLIRPEADRRGVNIEDRTEATTLPAVRADSLRLREVLLNLLSNAVKYNRPQGTVTVDAREHEGFLHIAIADTGMGIAEDMRHDVFQPFNRLRQDGESIEGTGIGLAIAKQFTELMNGKIGFNSEPGSGSTFWVEIPIAEDETVAPAQNASTTRVTDAIGSDANSGTYAILYVEDNLTNQELMRDICALRENIDVHCVQSAEEGFAALARQEFHLVFMDIALPGIDGFEALQRLQGSDVTRDIPVVALSANAMPSDIKKGVDAGFRRYLAKPIDIDEILSLIDGLRRG